MELFKDLVNNMGFPIAVTAFLLIRVEKKLDGVQEKLNAVEDKLDQINVTLIKFIDVLANKSQ